MIDGLYPTAKRVKQMVFFTSAILLQDFCFAYFYILANFLLSRTKVVSFLGKRFDSSRQFPTVPDSFQQYYTQHVPKLFKIIQNYQKLSKISLLAVVFKKIKVTYGYTRP